MISAKKAYQKAKISCDKETRTQIQVLNDNIKNTAACGYFSTHVHDYPLTNVTLTILESYGYHWDRQGNDYTISWRM